MSNRLPEYVLCAAVWVDDGEVHPHQPVNIESGVVFCGHRHHNCIVVAKLAFPDRNVDRNQGFLTSKGYYVDREVAARIAIEVGQVDPTRLRKPDCLFSEDLY